MFKTPILMLKMTFFWLLFRGKFEQKTQKSISFKNQWRLKNIKKAMVVKNIIAEDMPFTKSIFEQFWRSYCKKTIFVVFHFLKFLPSCNALSPTGQSSLFVYKYLIDYSHQFWPHGLNKVLIVFLVSIHFFLSCHVHSSSYHSSSISIS